MVVARLRRLRAAWAGNASCRRSDSHADECMKSPSVSTSPSRSIRIGSDSSRETAAGRPGFERVRRFTRLLYQACGAAETSGPPRRRVRCGVSFMWMMRRGSSGGMPESRGGFEIGFYDSAARQVCRRDQSAAAWTHERRRPAVPPLRQRCADPPRGRRSRPRAHPSPAHSSSRPGSPPRPAQARAPRARCALKA